MRVLCAVQLLELLAWFGTTQGDHFSNIMPAADDSMDEIVDVNDVRPFPSLPSA